MSDWKWLEEIEKEELAHENICFECGSSISASETRILIACIKTMREALEIQAAKDFDERAKPAAREALAKCAEGLFDE